MKRLVVGLSAAWFALVGCHGRGQSTEQPARAPSGAGRGTSVPATPAPASASLATADAPPPPPSSAPSSTAPAPPPDPPPEPAARIPGALPCGPKTCRGKAPVCGLEQDGYKVVGYECYPSIQAAREAARFPLQCWSDRDCRKTTHCFGSNEALCTQRGAPDIGASFFCETDADCQVRDIERLTRERFPVAKERGSRIVCGSPGKPGFPRACTPEGFDQP